MWCVSRHDLSIHVLFFDGPGSLGYGPLESPKLPGGTGGVMVTASYW